MLNANLLLVIAIAILGCLAMWIVPRVRIWMLGSKLPGPPARLLVGNTYAFLKRPEKTFRVIYELFATYGPVVRVWLGTKLIVGITSPADAQIVLTHPQVVNRDPHFDTLLNDLVDNGLLSSQGALHRQHRKLVAPSFHAKILSTFLPIFGEKAELLAKRLEALADGRPVDMKVQFSACTLDAILATAIGVSDVGLDFEGLVELKSMFDASVTLLYRRLVTPYLLWEWFYRWTPTAQLSSSLRKQREDFFRTLWTSKSESISKSGGKTNAVYTSGNKRIQSFLDMIFDTSVKGETLFTYPEIRDEVLTLAAAGMDTSANIMAYALILLGMYPEYQDLAVEEQQAIFKDSLEPADYHHLPEMPFLELIIKETLRLFPPVSLMPREIPVDIKISNDYVLPAGCSVFIFTHRLQRDVANYEDPERFWPERWLPENSVGRHPFAFLPFSAGSRNCIGQKYALMQMKATLSRLLRQFRFESKYTMKELNKIEINITNVSAVGYNVQTFPRKICIKDN